MGSLSDGLAPQWLALRESADVAARSTKLLDPLRAWLLKRSDPGLVIRDLGCGTGSMGRWLAGRLPGPQHWVLQDRDPELLARAIGSLPNTTKDRRSVSVSAELADITALGPADLAGTSLVTASAVLDMLTAPEIAMIAEACVTAGCPALITLSVVGRVEFEPVDPLDGELEAAFNDHQRRTEGGRTQLGPDAFDIACKEFARGMNVHQHASPWHLGPADPLLTAEWLRGWVGAAIRQDPSLADAGAAYLRRRLVANASGELWVVVEHGDLLALPEVSA
jgi:hypothetical protein